MPDAQPPKRPSLGKLAVQTILLFVVFLVFLFYPAGTLRFWQGWLYCAVFFLSTTVISIYLWSKDPALLRRRMRLSEEGEKNKREGSMQKLAGWSFLCVLVLAGLDRRFGWSMVPPAWSYAFCAVFLAGFTIVFMVFRENTFASSVIETDADQRVISTGPYRFVRHPMYAGVLLVFIATPFILGSFWTLLFVPLLISFMAARALREEKFLLNGLPGYKEYCLRTRTRIVPFVW